MSPRAATGSFPYRHHRSQADIAPPRASTADPTAWRQVVKPWFDRVYGPEGLPARGEIAGHGGLPARLERARQWRIAMKPHFDALYPEGDQ